MVRLIQVVVFLLLYGVLANIFPACSRNGGEPTNNNGINNQLQVNEETKEQCIERVKNELVENNRGEVLTKENMEQYYDEFTRRCNLVPK
ncbi:MAG: hypothetical protein RLZZ507_4497 [Cyanobacteriota bacterium]|jgi:hypothetical protein